MIEYQKELHNTAMRRWSMRHEAAEDLVQETFLRAHRFRHLFKQGTNYRAWLYCLMRNARIESMRKRRLPMGDPIDLDKLISGEPMYDDGCEVMLQTVKQLPPPFKAVIELVIQGKTPTEIAQCLGVPDGTVKSRTHRALRLMRRLLNQGDDDGPSTATAIQQSHHSQE